MPASTYRLTMALVALLIAAPAVAEEKVDLRAALTASVCKTSDSGGAVSCTESPSLSPVTSVSLTPDPKQPRHASGSLKLTNTVEGISFEALLSIDRIELVPAPSNPTKYGFRIGARFLKNEAEGDFFPEALRPGVSIIPSADFSNPSGDYWSDLDSITIHGERIRVSDTEFVVPILSYGPERILR